MVIVSDPEVHLFSSLFKYYEAVKEAECVLVRVSCVSHRKREQEQRDEGEKKPKEITLNGTRA